MTFVIFTMGGAVLAYLGFMTKIIGAECEIDVTPWQIILIICAVLMLIAGVVDGVLGIVRLIRRRGRGNAREKYGIYPPPKRSGRAKPPAIPPKRPTKTGAKGKK